MSNTLRAKHNLAHRAEMDTLIEVAPTLDQRAGRSGENSFATSGGLIPEVAAPVNAAEPSRRNGGSNPTVGTMIPEVCGTLSDGAHHGGGRTVRTPTPGASSLPEVAMSLCQRDAKGPDSDTKAGHLIHEGGGFDEAYTFPWQAGGSHGLSGSLIKNQTMAVAFKASHFTRGKDGSPSEVTPPLSADADKGDQDTVVAFQPRIARNGRGDMGDAVNALQAHSGQTGKGDAAPCVATRHHVRRLTVIECERLQGFPDGWTQVPHRGKPAADGPRYRAIGNSMAVNVMSFIGQRITELDASTSERKCVLARTNEE